MKYAWLKPKRILGVAAVLLIASSLLPQRGANLISTPPRQLVDALLTPTNQILTAISTRLRPAAAPETDLPSRQQLAQQLDEQKVYTSQLEQEIGILQKLLRDLRLSQTVLDLGNVSMAAANVTAFSGSEGSPQLTIVRNRDDNLREGLAVISGAALVGRVVRVDTLTAQVKLITAPGTSLHVRIVPPSAGQAPYTLEDTIHVADDGESFFVDVDKGHPVKVGDVAHLADDDWLLKARGSIVGRVAEVVDHPEKPMLLKRVIVRPDLNLARLARVWVLVPE